MTRDIIKTSFAGGELTPGLNGRVDLAKYAVGAAVMRNFFVDFRGGASTRPGTRHVGASRVIADDPKPRLIPFVFSTDQAYVLELNGSTMRVIYRGAYVTEPTKAITAVALGATTVLTSAAHGYAVGDFVRVEDCVGATRPNGISGLNGRTFYVSAVTANTITLDEPGLLGGADYVPVVSTSWAAWTSGGTVARIYEIDTPWAASALFALNFVQSADVLTVVHPDYPPHNVQRIAQDDWQIVQETYGAEVNSPTITTASAINNDGADPQYFYSYIVTTVDTAGRESNPSGVGSASFVNRALSQTASPNVVNKLAWTPETGAYKYRIYKANPVPDGQQGGGPYVYGLIGNAFEASFVDVNYAPEFDQGPPQARNPFLDKAIASATITASGQGYVAPYLSIADGTGSGASIALTSDLSLTASPYGELVAATVVVGGTNYSAPVATVLDAAPLGSGLTLQFDGTWIANPLGTGFVPGPGSITVLNGGANYHQGSYSNFMRATAGNQVGTNVLPIDITSVVNGVVQAVAYAPSDVTPTNTTGLSSTGTGDTLTFATIGTDTPGSGATVSLALGGTTNPSCVAYFEQRRTFAGSRAMPSTFWLSRPGQFTNFDVSDPIQDDDAITAALYAQEVNLIASLVSVTNGLMALTSAGAYLITGGTNDAPVTPSTIRAPAQAFSGAQALAPLRIGDHVLYATARGSSVRDLAFNFYSNSFTGNDVSVLAGHLLEGRRITQWCYAEEPNKLAHMVRDDGVMLSLTYLREQEVYGWARHDTAGEYVSVCAIPEDREDAVYVVVRRYLGAYGYRYHVERMAARDFGANPAAGIAAQPEKAWCVDDGASYPLTEPNTAILYGVTTGIGEIYSATIDAPGTGYAADAEATIADMAGTGASLSLTVTGGQITGVSITTPGSGYLAPVVTVSSSDGGSGAVITLRPVVKVLLTFDAAAFSSADVGKVCRVRGGRGPVLSSPAANQLLVDFFAQPPSGLPNLPGIVLPRIEAGDWSLTAEVSIIGGLDHLNGATVQILADGNVQTPKLVEDGCIELDEPATAIIVGQGFTAQLQTMRLEVVAQPTSQGQRKTIPDAHIRVKDTRGLVAGPNWNALTEIKEREDEPMGQPIGFQVGGGLPLPELYEDAPAAPRPLWYADKYLIMSGSWDDDGVVCVQQSYPLPATVLALIPAVLLGDDAK